MKRITAEEAAAIIGCDVEPLSAPYYEALWHHDDIGVCGVSRLLFHYTVHLDMNAMVHGDSYCFATKEFAEQALDEWDPATETEPRYWHKHPATGRRRAAFRIGDTLARVENGQLAELLLLPAGMSDEEVAVAVERINDALMKEWDKPGP